MKVVFDLSFRQFQEFVWLLGPYNGYKDKIINGANVISVSGGFGTMMFQMFSVPLIDICVSNYLTHAGFDAWARSLYKCIDLSVIAAGSFQQRSLPFADNN